MGDIDIGSPAINRASATGINAHTKIEGANTANADGTIDTGKIWLNVSSTSDIYFGTFSKSGSVFTCRDSESVGHLAAGSEQTATGLTITVETGDYLGTHSKGGTVKIDYASSGGVARWWVSGEYIDPTDSATFAESSGYIMSLGGTGEEAAAGLSIPVAMHHYKMMRS